MFGKRSGNQSGQSGAPPGTQSSPPPSPQAVPQNKAQQQSVTPPQLSQPASPSPHDDTATLQLEALSLHGDSPEQPRQHSTSSSYGAASEPQQARASLPPEFNGQQDAPIEPMGATGASFTSSEPEPSNLPQTGLLPQNPSGQFQTQANEEGRNLALQKDRSRTPSMKEDPQSARSEKYYDVKTTVFNALIDTIDLTQLAKLEADSAREEIRDIVSDIISIKHVVLSIAEQEELLQDICNDVLGYGPLEPLLMREEISDIMINGAESCFIEIKGKIQKSAVHFSSNTQLMNICQRIVTQVGRRVDESSPICDARLPDGSRVNVIAPPLAIDGVALTIRKFKKDKITLDQLVDFGSISPHGRTILGIIGRCRCNVIISGGTGSGKTTLLNCMTASIGDEERIITCEDSAELQLQQPHVVRLETRPPNIEGEGEITMRDLVRNCLRMRPERIIVGEVRGAEAFDLLQAMNTGHDGSMGTLHANSPREAIARIESMIMMGGFSLPSKSIREMIVGSVDIIIQASRMRDGTRKITHITEVFGMEDEIVTLQDIFLYDLQGEDAQGKMIGQHRSTGIVRPKFWDRAQYYGEDRNLATALAESELQDDYGQPLGENLV